MTGLERRLPSILAASVDWDQMKKTISVIGRSSRFRGLLRHSSGALDRSDTEQNADAATGAQAKADLSTEIPRAVASVLGIANRLDVQRPLAELGFDSLMAVELSLRIEALVGVSMPKMTLLQQGLTVARLIDMVTESAGGVPAASAEPPPSDTADAGPSISAEKTGLVARNDVRSAADKNEIPTFSDRVRVDDLSDQEVSQMLADLIKQ